MFWTPRLCRICANVGAVTYPIFSGALPKDVDVEAKFRKCFQMIVYKDDFKPKEVCNECLDKLDEYCTFVDLCVASNNKFESILYQTNRSEPQENWHGRIDCKLSADLFSPTENGVIVKPTEEVLPVYEQPVTQTVLRHSSEFYKPPELELEEFQFDAPTVAPAVQVEEKRKPFGCTECDKSFMRKLTLKVHMSTHTNVKPYRCDVCGESFAVRWTMARHRRVHENVYQCEYCGKSFQVQSKLDRHVRTHTNERPFECDVPGCGKTFSDKRNLVGHALSHTKERNYRCEICKKSYKAKNRLKDHQKVHTDVRYSCDVCGKTFKWKTNLTVHMRKHVELQCVTCKRTFNDDGAFQVHRSECGSVL